MTPGLPELLPLLPGDPAIVHLANIFYPLWFSSPWA